MRSTGVVLIGGARSRTATRTRWQCSSSKMGISADGNAPRFSSSAWHHDNQRSGDQAIFTATEDTTRILSDYHCRSNFVRGLLQSAPEQDLDRIDCAADTLLGWRMGTDDGGHLSDRVR